jgi:hypothetical protein
MPTRCVTFALCLALLRSAVSTQPSHFPGENCLRCHQDLKVAGTLFADRTATLVATGVGVSLSDTNGADVVLDPTDSFGRIAPHLVPDGVYIVTIGPLRSRTWHRLPEQASCNVCHMAGGNFSTTRTKILPQYHTRLTEVVTNELPRRKKGRV